MHVLPVLQKDGYKVGHFMQYPAETNKVYSNFTPRSGKRRVNGIGGVINFGLQYYLKEYLVGQFDAGFFSMPRATVLAEYERRISNYLGPDAITYDHIAALHDLGYLPIHIKSLPEGMFVPYGIPVLTIVNTHPEFYWLTNMLETQMSSVLWKASTSATTAFIYRKVFDEYCAKTGGSPDFVQFQGHDFSFRGMCGIEDAMVSGGAHLLSFTGTDTIPAIDFLEQYYYGDAALEMIGVSVAATEHSVMCMGGLDDEMVTFNRLLTKVYPAGILSVVSDTWDLWRVLTEYLPKLKEEVLARDGKLVIRPDSGNPADIICGDPNKAGPAGRGAIQLLWDTFGGTKTALGFKELDPHVGLIYGDGINPIMQREILARLAANGFASTNVVLGLGSYTYQYVTRDTDGWAMKATYGEINGVPIEIYKSPVTDDGTKFSAKGLLAVHPGPNGLVLKQSCTPEEENQGLLETVFYDGFITKVQTLKEIRERVAANDLS